MRITSIILQALALFFLSIAGYAKSGELRSMALHEAAARLSAFGERIPQEKVYVHMDNTGYCLGDTIWFKAYTQQTNDGRPSSVSGVLYAELFNNDGYLVERKVVETVKGQGHGFFALPIDMRTHAGYYELRVYSRWQLNWGQTVYPHSKYTEKWFFNDVAAREYFRDYDKLYSRVFPVYDRMEDPEYETPGMTLRTLVRYYSQEPDKPTPTLHLYPEGGGLVRGMPCRVAFEAVMSDGEYITGHLQAGGREWPVMHRGRGVFEITPGEGGTGEVEFVSDSGEKVRAALPKAEARGVALKMTQENDGWRLTADLSEGLEAGDLGLTVMHQGMLLRFDSLQSAHTDILLPLKELRPGVNQATVFDRNGRVWADRLFFVSDLSGNSCPTVCHGLKDNYQPLEGVDFSIEARGAANEVISLSVRDAGQTERTYDSGNILTEMLLCSEIKGFVPQPEWYFATDDEEHRQALDLLMMTQGWRRFNWQEMALEKGMELTHPMEPSTPLLMGAVHTYRAAPPTRGLASSDFVRHEMEMGIPPEMRSRNTASPYDERGKRTFHGKSLKRSRSQVDGEKLRHEVKVYARFSDASRQDNVEGEVATRDGQFRIPLPRFEGDCLLRIAARDTSGRRNRKKKEFQWSTPYFEYGHPPFYVKLSHPYPHFVKPFDHYQLVRPKKRQPSADTGADLSLTAEGRTLEQLTVYPKHGGRIADRYAQPAVVMDAYEAFNDAADAGLMEAYMGPLPYMARAMAYNIVGDMNVGRRYDVFYEVPEDREELSLKVVDSLYVFTDYAPRKQGYNQYTQENIPDVFSLLSHCPDGTVREVSRDRFIRLKGFAYTGDFYHPDYSKHKPEGKKDYRRTLYWNPSLKLDGEGRAKVSLYNNSIARKVVVEAEGLTQEGKFIHYKKD